MSLPTYATYYNASGETIARVFVDCGWWLTEETFLECFDRLPHIKDTVAIELYGIRIENSALGDMSHPSWEECRRMIIDSSPAKIKEFGMDKELKEAVRAIYRDHQKIHSSDVR